jgi:(p)ppGpp synthase/HD superfamily hydrolase
MASTLSPRFDDALTYASRLHAGQLRKGTAIPYVSHLLAVTAIVLEHGGGENEAIAALLHDAVEDQGGLATREAILERFGEGVAAIVDGCTDAEIIPKPPWRERKEAYVAHVSTASPSVRLVSAADKLHNARGILADYRQLGEGLWCRFRGGRDGTLWYYRALADAFRAVESTALTEELDRTVAKLEELATIQPTIEARNIAPGF